MVKNSLNIKIYSLYFFFIFLAILSCEKDVIKQTPELRVPIIKTSVVWKVTKNSANCGGEIISDEGLSISERGVCWSTNSTPTINDNFVRLGVGNLNYYTTITDLQPNTNYYIRAYAKNYDGIGYGDILLFKTKNLLTVIDIEGNEYNTILIGTQLWMAENLKVEKLNNGFDILKTTSDLDWSNTRTATFSYLNNNTTVNKSKYGALYNWHSVNTGKLCPIGWHVPNEIEWNLLINNLGGASIAANKLKEAGEFNWESPNTASNETSFTALPGGKRAKDGMFLNSNTHGYWWSKNAKDTTNANFYYMRNSTSNVVLDFTDKKNGLSVRCIKN